MCHHSLALTIALVLLPLASFAQDPATENRTDPAEPNKALETITVVGTRTERALSKVAATVSVKTAEDLEQELARDIVDLVRFEPGVSVGGTGSRFGLGGFNIRESVVTGC